MEGKTAACAHFSPVGNVAAATCDCWSNESVQNIKLLGGMAPTCSMEQLIYDCRLFDQALADGPEGAATLQRWLVNSDAGRDAQAFVLTPENAVTLARAIVSETTPYAAGRAVASTALRLLREGAASGTVHIGARELPWLDRMDRRLAALPSDEGAFIDQMLAEVDCSSFVAADYDL
jgi:methanol--5-hydroxybenzimidazolylcobamide Co-methyltransferase